LSAKEIIDKVMGIKPRGGEIEEEAKRVEAKRVFEEIVRRLRLVAKNPSWAPILKANEVYVGGSLARTLLGMEDKLFRPESDVDVFIWTGGIFPLSSMVCHDLESDLHNFVYDHPIRVHSPTAEEWKEWTRKGEPLIRILI